MYLVIKMSGKFYATEKSFEVSYFEKELKDYIEDFTSQGTVVMMVQDLQDVQDLFKKYDYDDDIEITIVE